jgi:hypothetical protein
MRQLIRCLAHLIIRRAVDFAAAALDGLFDHPAGSVDVVSNSALFVGRDVPRSFFNRLL